MPAHCQDSRCQEKDKVPRAYYNYPHIKQLIYCNEHKLPGMINVSNPLCTDERCWSGDPVIPKRASYNFEGEKNPLYCEYHLKDGMINITKINQKCKFQDENGKKCTKRASYNYEGLKPLYCKLHRPDKIKMVDVNNKKCEDEKCTKMPSFNYPDSYGYRFCGKHASKYPGMIDKRQLKYLCIDCGKKEAYYNLPGHTAKYCKPCGLKIGDVVDVRSKMCEKCGQKQRVYNFKGLKPRFCGNCKDDKMIDTKSTKCKKCGISQARFNFDGESAKYCGKCVEDGMKNVKIKYCIYSDKNGKCNNPAYYNDIGEITPIFCGFHSGRKMINVIYSYELCVHEECSNNVSVATHGPLFGKKIHCEKHRLTNEIKNNNPKCEGDDSNERCMEIPVYANNNEDLPIRCENHKLYDDKNIIEKPCNSCGLLYLLNESNNLCENCDKNRSIKYFKSKEMAIKQLLEESEIKYETWNKQVSGGCSKRRPDFLIDKDTFVIIVEVDENQHKHYGPRDCEIIRMIQIHNDIGLPCIFVKFNPDSYRDDGGKLIRSNLGRNRIFLQILRGLINRDPINEKIKDSLCAYYLFYDGFNGTPEMIEIDYINKSIEQLVLEIY